MPAWSSSSLAASDLPRHKSSGFIKNGLFRHSKQQMVEKKMFGSRRGMHGKDLQIGRKFRKGMKSHFAGDMKSSSISPSVDEFDKMMKSSVTHNPNKKKSMITKKFFG
jgi:hypothetical protein